MLLEELIELLQNTPAPWKKSAVNFWVGDYLTKPVGVPNLRFVSDDLGSLRFSTDEDPYHIQSVAVIIHLDIV